MDGLGRRVLVLHHPSYSRRLVGVTFVPRTLENEGSSASNQVNGTQGTQPNGVVRANGANETFQQLRQAVLSSLDFNDNVEATLDWEESLDEFVEESQISPSGVGKAVYEVRGIEPLVCLIFLPAKSVWKGNLSYVLKTKCASFCL